MNSKDGAKKARQTLIKRLGSEEAYKEYMRDIASRGKVKRENTTFYRDRELAARAGSLGGKKRKTNEKATNKKNR